jgi:hypothetical protein
MTNKQIKDFYLSLIDNEEAVWTKEKKEYDATYRWVLYHCKIGDISIESLPNYKLVFTHSNGKSWLSTRSDSVSFGDIGISKFRLLFPFFGVAARIERRIKTDKSNKNKKESTSKLESVSKVLMNDKALLRDMKLKELDIE